jgi:autophagy-related protein 101
VFDSSFESLIAHESDMQLSLSFYEKRLKKYLFTTKEEKIFWEMWHIPVVMMSPAETPAERNTRHAETSNMLKERILAIITNVNEKRDHIPPVPADGKPSLYPAEVRSNVVYSSV